MRIKQLIIIIIFFIFPLILSYFLLPLWVSEDVAIGKANIFGPLNNLTYKEIVNINISSNEIYHKIKYNLFGILGKNLEISTINLCFFNNGSQYLDINEENFLGTLTINNQKNIPLKYNDKTCYNLNSNIEKFNFKLVYEIKNYNPIDENRWEENIKNIGPKIDWYRKTEINCINFICLLLVIYFAMWAIFWLITRVIYICFPKKYKWIFDYVLKELK